MITLPSIRREHFDPGHLRVEELHDPLQGIRDVVRDKQQPQTSGGEVRGHPLPEAVDIRLSVWHQQPPKFLTGIETSGVG